MVRYEVTSMMEPITCFDGSLIPDEIDSRSVCRFSFTWPLPHPFNHFWDRSLTKSALDLLKLFLLLSAADGVGHDDCNRCSET